MINTIILWILGFGALAGGLDLVFGCRFGLGQRFEEGFRLLGPTGLSMAGILCLTPLVGRGLEQLLVPLCLKTGIDPGLAAGVIAIDMGGYQLAQALSGSAAMVRYSGLVIGATLGCTICFTIPVGMGMLREEDKPFFAKGMLLGLGTLPACLLVGGLLAGLPLNTLIFQSMPVLVLCMGLMIAMKFRPGATVAAFTLFSKGIRIVTLLALTAGAFRYMTGIALIPGMDPVEDAMAVVSSIGIVLLGSLPAAELLRRLLKKPMGALQSRTGMKEESLAGLLVILVSPVPAIAMLRDMDDRGKILCSGCMVCGASAIAAHTGFTFGMDAAFVGSLLAAKLTGMAVCALVCLLRRGK